jgi:hypothetical protein
MECQIRDVGRSSAGAIGRRRFSDMAALRVKLLGNGGILSHVDGVGGVDSAMADFIIWPLH